MPRYAWADALELYLIYRIIAIVAAGRGERWQDRWVEYRALAEMLRDVRFLAYVGEYGYIQRTGELDPASSAWFVWYLRATIREIVLPHVTLDGTYQRSHLNAIENDAVNDQIKYHRANSQTLARMHRWLYAVGESFFLLTGGILISFLVLHVVPAFDFLIYGTHAFGDVEQAPYSCFAFSRTISKGAFYPGNSGDFLGCSIARRWRGYWLAFARSGISRVFPNGPPRHVPRWRIFLRSLISRDGG